MRWSSRATWPNDSSRPTLARFEVVPLDAPLNIEFGAYALPYGDDDFLHYLNNWLQYYKNNGTLDSIYDGVFGSDPDVNIWPRQ